MCFLCICQHTPIGGWQEPDRPPSYRYCNCPFNVHEYRHRRVYSVGWVIVPYFRRHLTHKSTGVIHYGLLRIILDWSALPACPIYRVPGRVRSVYRNGRRFHFQGCVASKSMLHLELNPGMCGEAFGEMQETSGHIITRHGLIVDAGCINSKLQTALPCSNNRTHTNFGSSLGISIFQLYYWTPLHDIVSDLLGSSHWRHL